VPYESVTYAIERKRGALVVTVSKRFVKPFGGRDEVSLLTEEAWAELRTALEAGGVFTLPSVKGPKARSTTRVEADWGSRQHSWTVDDPGISFDGRHAHCIALVRALVSKRVGEIEFRDVMLLPGESGRLRVFADRPATVALDGVLLGSNTPLLSLRVSAGVHRVELRPLRSDAVYSYSVKVEAGKTTSLSVELK